MKTNLEEDTGEDGKPDEGTPCSVFKMFKDLPNCPQKMDLSRKLKIKKLRTT